MLGCAPINPYLLTSRESSQPAAPTAAPIPPTPRLHPPCCRAAADSYLEKIYKPLSTERTCQPSRGLLQRIDQGRILPFFLPPFLFFSEATWDCPIGSTQHPVGPILLHLMPLSQAWWCPPSALRFWDTYLSPEFQRRGK